MEKPTKILADEHQHILKIVNALSKECEVLESGGDINKKFFEKAIDFIRNYADKFHHAKEEKILFRELCAGASSMSCNPTEQMLYEHDQGRDFVKNMKIALKENNKEKLIENARAYANLLREHIDKEDNILYPMADDVIDMKRQKVMLVEFKKAEKKRFIKGTKEKYIRLAKELENE